MFIQAKTFQKAMIKVDPTAFGHSLIIAITLFTLGLTIKNQRCIRRIELQDLKAKLEALLKDGNKKTD